MYSIAIIRPGFFTGFPGTGVTIGGSFKHWLITLNEGLQYLMLSVAPPEPGP